MAGNRVNNGSMRLDNSVIFAAGGLLWRETSNGREILLVFRGRYKDWTLPKGKVNPEDKDLIATAKREVFEETGYRVEVTGFVGCTCYEHAGRPKVVLFWHMAPQGGADFTPSEEVEKCEWFSITEAICRLSHENETNLMRRYAGEPEKVPRWWQQPIVFKRSFDIRLNRLKASIGAYRHQLELRLLRLDRDDQENLARGCEASRLLDLAERKLEEGPKKINEGWRYFCEACRLGLYLCNKEELYAEATSLRLELSSKLGGTWREDAALSLLPRRKEHVQPPPVEHVLKAMEIRDEHFSNTYFKIDLVKRQLQWLTVLLLIILSLLATLVVTFFGTGIPNDIILEQFSLPNLGLVFLFGMLGGTMTTCYSLIRSPSKSPIPEQLLTFILTLARPIVGGVAAIAVFLALRADLLPIEIKGSRGAMLLLLAFAAGFSEQLMMGTMKKITDKN